MDIYDLLTYGKKPNLIPKYCPNCGEKLLYSEKFKSFDTETGEPKGKKYCHLQCPKYFGYFGYEKHLDIEWYE